MTKQKFVLVEINSHGDPVRIFRTVKEAMKLPVELVQKWPRGLAIRSIRETIYVRSKDVLGNGRCEFCGQFVTRDSGEMHEKIPRGRGGEISLENSVFICKPCHRGQNGAHGNRRWQTAKLPDEVRIL